MISCSMEKHSVIVSNGPQVKCREFKTSKRHSELKKRIHLIPQNRKRVMGIEEINRMNERSIDKAHAKQSNELSRKKKKY